MENRLDSHPRHALFCSLAKKLSVVATCLAIQGIATIVPMRTASANFCRAYYKQLNELSPQDEAAFRTQIADTTQQYPPFAAISMADNANFIRMKETTEKFYDLLENATDEQLASREFIQKLLDMEPEIGRVFFDAENAVLKELNDIVLPDNKGFVTTLLDAYKQMLWDRVQASKLPDGTALSDYIVGQYADAKNIRFAFNRDDPALTIAVKEAYRQASQDLRRLIYSEESMIAERFLGATGISRDPASINMAGLDDVDPDFANTAARKGRNFFDKSAVDDDLDQLAKARKANEEGGNVTEPENVGGTAPRTFASVKAELDAAGLAAEKARMVMQLRFSRKYPKLMEPFEGNDNIYLPTREFLEVMLKTKIPKGKRTSRLNFLLAIKKEIRERFPEYDLSIDDLNIIFEYKNNVDIFSPGNYIVERDPVDYHDFDLGMLLIDMTGQNVKNFRETAAAVAESAWAGRGTVNQFDSRRIIRMARQGERRATADLNARQKYIYGVMDKHFDCKKMPISGDDGACVPASRITEAQKQAFLREIGDHPEWSGNFRLSFVEPNYYNPRNGKRTSKELDSFAYEDFSGSAEAIEKEMRKTLRKRLVDVIGYEEVQKLLLAVDVRPFESTVPIQVVDYPGGPPRTLYEARGQANIYMGAFKNLPPETTAEVYRMIREVFV